MVPASSLVVGVKLTRQEFAPIIPASMAAINNKTLGSHSPRLASAGPGQMPARPQPDAKQRGATDKRPVNLSLRREVELVAERGVPRRKISQ